MKYGMPAVGKLTVARELADLTGFRLFHNHLTVDLLLTVFDFGSQPFVELRESIWLSVFDRACRAGLAGLIFTFAPERTVRQRFVDETIETVSSHGGEVVFVELTCPREELEGRLRDPSRGRHGKLTSLEQFRELMDAGAFSAPLLPTPALSIDTSRIPPGEAAALIVRECGLV
ncbi:MAG: AAA family ATPase [Gemmatimonadetes bacterium]|nr:AAA family ATPase [Gemmatimonadota bacterium]